MELRLAIEVEAAALAAERTTPQALALHRRGAARHARPRSGAARVRSARTSPCIAPSPWRPATRASSSCCGIWAAMSFPRQSVRVAVDAPEEQRLYLMRIQKEHARICEAIAARKPAEARKAMRVHLTNSLKRYRRLAERPTAIDQGGRMKRVLLTGAAGDIGGRLRKLLKPIYPELRLSDIKQPANLGADEAFVAADLAKMDEVEKICDGIEGIIHLGGFSVEGPWETILQSNIIGCYNLFEAARRKGVKRVIFASSNHAVGFYPRTAKIGVDVTVRPDSRYGVSKAFGEALGAFYCRQARPARAVPAHRQRRRQAARPAAAVDLAEARGSRAADPHRPGESRPALRDLLRRLLQRARVVGQQPRLRATAIGRPARPRTIARRRWPRRPRSRPIRSATSSRAARSAAPSSTATPRASGSRAEPQSRIAVSLVWSEFHVLMEAEVFHQKDLTQAMARPVASGMVPRACLFCR